MSRLQGAIWRNVRGDLDLIYYEPANSLGHIKGYYRHKETGKVFTHWLNDEEIMMLDEPFRDLEPMDLLFVDIVARLYYGAMLNMPTLWKEYNGYEEIQHRSEYY